MRKDWMTLRREIEAQIRNLEAEISAKDAEIWEIYNRLDAAEKERKALADEAERFRRLLTPGNPFLEGAKEAV